MGDHKNASNEILTAIMDMASEIEEMAERIAADDSKEMRAELARIQLRLRDLVAEMAEVEIGAQLRESA